MPFILFFLATVASPVYAKEESASGAGTTEALACEQAKMLTQTYCGGNVESFSDCKSCGKQIVNGSDEWTCQVDARCAEPTGGVKWN